MGLALSDESQIIATPLETLTRRAGKRFPMPRFLELVAQHGPVGAVVGLPLTPEGTEEESAVAARSLAEVVGRRSQLPVELWDERMSTSRRSRHSRTGRNHPGTEQDVDSLAAAVSCSTFSTRDSDGH